jgi:hypothetical protein
MQNKFGGGGHTYAYPKTKNAERAMKVRELTREIPLTPNLTHVKPTGRGPRQPPSKRQPGAGPVCLEVLLNEAPYS